MKIKDINNRLAVLGTNWFSSMWTFYLFFFLGLSVVLPLFPGTWKTTILLISSAWLQLFALPLLAVGNSVLAQTSEKRAKQDHEMIKAEFELLKKDAINEQKERLLLAMLRQDILDRLDSIERKLERRS